MEACFNVIKKTINDKKALCYVAPAQIPQWKKYIEFVEDFSEVYGFDPNDVNTNLSKNSIIPLLKFKKDSEVYITTCRQIAKALKEKKRVDRKNVNAFMGQTPPLIKMKGNLECNPPIILKSSKRKEITSLNQNLLQLLGTPTIKKLQEIMEVEDLENEYSALIRAINAYVPKKGK